MKKLLAVLAVIVILMIVLFVPIINDNAAVQMVKELKELPLPIDTDYIEAVSMAGNLTDREDDVELFASILIKSAMPFEAVKEHYDSMSDSEVTYYVEKQDEQQIKALDNTKASFKANVDDGDYYIVYVWDKVTGSMSALDYRRYIH